MMSVGFRAEDWNSRSTVHFNMFPNILKSILQEPFSNSGAYLNVPIEFSATQE